MAEVSSLFATRRCTLAAFWNVFTNIRRERLGSGATALHNELFMLAL